MGRGALDFARKACEQTGWEAAGYLDTLAVACACLRSVRRGGTLADQGVELATDAEKADYQSRLDLYKEGRPYREV